MGEESKLEWGWLDGFPGDSGSEAEDEEEDESVSTDEDAGSVEGEEVLEDATPVVAGEASIPDESKKSSGSTPEVGGAVSSDAGGAGQPESVEAGLVSSSGGLGGNTGSVGPEVEARGESRIVDSGAVLRRGEASVGWVGAGGVGEVGKGVVARSVGLQRPSLGGWSEPSGYWTKLVVELTGRSLGPVGGSLGAAKPEERRHASPKRVDERSGELQVCSGGQVQEWFVVFRGWCLWARRGRRGSLRAWSSEYILENTAMLGGRKSR